MGLNIKRQQLANPLLQDLLRKLTATFSRIGKDFFVIGATARDIILQVLTDTSAHRMTRDLDIAIAVPDWASYELIQDAMIADGFRKSERQKQRFYYDYYEVYVVPYGQLAAYDVVDLVSPKTLRYFRKILEDELAKGDGSRLFMQILETNSSVNYSEVRKVFNTMIDVFKKFTDTDK